MNKFAIVFPAMLVAIILPSQALSAKKIISDAGIKNFGSSLALIQNCEREGYLPIGTLSNIMSPASSALSEESWIKTKKQFQISLHEKKQYSIAYSKWYDFKVDKKSCEDLGKVIPSMIDMFKRF